MNRQEKKAVQARNEAEIKRMTRSLAGLDRNGDIKNAQTTVTNSLERGGALYKSVKKSLSGSSADAGLVKNVVRVSCNTAKRINSKSRSFSLTEKLLKLKRSHHSELSRFLVNTYANEIICYAPTFEFFYGAIKMDGLIVGQRKKRARLQMDDPALRLTKATEKNITTDCEQDSTPKEVEAIHEKIRRLTVGKPRGVKFLPAIVDPKSYAHTVENLFHAAFLVKEGKVGLKKGDGDAPMISLTNEDVKPKDQVCNQSILSFSMYDYKRWVATMSRG